MYLRRTCWADPCSSWFKQGRKDGNVVMWPGNRLAFFDILKEPKYEDYEIKYWGQNRWAFLGNGFTTEGFDGSDTSKCLNCKLYPEPITEGNGESIKNSLKNAGRSIHCGRERAQWRLG